jgi:hypothetical protein
MEDESEATEEEGVSVEATEEEGVSTVTTEEEEGVSTEGVSTAAASPLDCLGVGSVIGNEETETGAGAGEEETGAFARFDFLLNGSGSGRSKSEERDDEEAFRSEKTGKGTSTGALPRCWVFLVCFDVLASVVAVESVTAGEEGTVAALPRF